MFLTLAVGIDKMTTCVGESSPEIITAFMQQVIVEYGSFAHDTRRNEARENVAVPVSVQPLTDEFIPVGTPFPAVTRDLSSSGMGIFSPARYDLSWLQVTLQSPTTGRQMRLLGKVEHCTPCGPFFLIGCRFAADKFTADQDDA